MSEGCGRALEEWKPGIDMAQPSVAREPSMEEILASIRRIIESNETGPTGAFSGQLPPVYDDEDEAASEAAFVAEPISPPARVPPPQTRLLAHGLRRIFRRFLKWPWLNGRKALPRRPCRLPMSPPVCVLPPTVTPPWDRRLSPRRRSVARLRPGCRPQPPRMYRSLRRYRLPTAPRRSVRRMFGR